MNGAMRSASVAMPRGVDLFVAVENLFNERYETGKTPVTTIGRPILVRVGFRLSLVNGKR
jgi:outer membrane receptor protein involved in Fe transport